VVVNVRGCAQCKACQRFCLWVLKSWHQVNRRRVDRSSLSARSLRQTFIASTTTSASSSVYDYVDANVRVLARLCAAGISNRRAGLRGFELVSHSVRLTHPTVGMLNARDDSGRASILRTSRMNNVTKRGRRLEDYPTIRLPIFTDATAGA
jgi:hypothetical protein